MGKRRDHSPKPAGVNLGRILLRHLVAAPAAFGAASFPPPPANRRPPARNVAQLILVNEQLWADTNWARQ